MSSTKRKQSRPRRILPLYRLLSLLAVILVTTLATISLLASPVQGQSTENRSITLTTEERAWLDNNPDKLILYYNTEFPPIEFAGESGEFIGMGADVIRLVESQLGIIFYKQACLDWNEHLAALENGECAVAPTIVSTVERQRFAYFTTPYATVPVVVITDRASPRLSLTDLEGTPVAVVSGFATEEYLRDRLDDTSGLITVDNVSTGVRSVSFGQADAFVENLAVAAYYIDQEGIPNLKVAGVTDYSFAWSIGISHKYPELFSAVQKALDSIPDKELEIVRKNWISLEVPSGLNQETVKRIKLVASFVGLLLISLAVISFFLKRQLNAKVASLRVAQEELLDKTNRLAMAIEVTQAGSWEFHIDTGALHVSEQWYTMLGYTAGAAVTTLEKAAKIIHPKDFELIDRRFKEYFSGDGQGVIAVEMRVLDSEGAYRWIMCKGRVTAWDDSGQPIRMTGLNLDIHHLRKIQQKLAQSEKRFKAIFHHAPYPMLITCLETGKCLDASPSFLDRWGLTREGLQQFRLSELNLLPEAEEEQIIDIIHREGMVPNRLTSITGENGTAEHFLISSVLMEIEGEARILTMLVDVTEAKRAEETLRESEFRFRSFYDSNPEGVILIDIEGRILDVNHSLLASSGYTLQEIVDRHFLDFVPEEYHATALAALQNVQLGMRGGQPVEMAYVIKDGTQLPISVMGWRLTDVSSKPVLLGVFIKDLTAEKQLEQEKSALQSQLLQSQKMEAIGTLAGGIAHDFNNMLFGILGYTDMALAAVEEDSEAAGLLREVIIAGQRASDLTRQILTFARRSERKVKSVDLVVLVREVLRLIGSTLPKTIAIKREINLESAVVMADDSELHQVLINLCTNAGHAMRESGGKLTFGLNKIDVGATGGTEVPGLVPGPYIEVSVRDTGSGITQEILERVFEPFFTTKERGEGTGMGLSVVHGIITGLGGTITVESVVGEGSTFRVYIPPAAEPGNAKPQIAAQPMSGTESILIVDDEEALVQMLGRQLSRLGYKTSVFSDSRQALEVLRANPQDYDLLLTDLAMPHLPGDQLVLEVRRVRADIPVVVCTGFMDPVTENHLDSMGIKHRLAKPLNQADLAAMLRRALGDQLAD